MVNLTADGNGISPGARIALRDPNVAGHPVIAIQDVEAVEALSKEDVDFIAQQVYRTNDEAHPGVATFASLGRVLVSGPIEVLNLSYFETDFSETFRTAVEIRSEIEKRGWNVWSPSRPEIRCTAHEELCKWRSRQWRPTGF